ncbi:MAG: hypothetical protein BWY71_01530 [Planctomycetes bacterium ADurb.Bin412]|nr:MAG: hypothetical protein BWY71_01530 [Planctomycetes bacterium ADurb.Bin412]
MAKMFYSQEEVQAKLGRSTDEIKKIVADGKLREFRDGNKIMYKVDEVDNLVSELGGDSGEIGLAPSDTGTQINLSASDTGSQLGLAPSGDTGSQLGLSASDSSDQIGLDDTGEAAASKDDTVITSYGVNALEDSSSILESVDPMGQTQIAPEFDDQVSLDSGSSGSGLLDLTREADDTSLGAELLEEIYPGKEEGAIETQLPSDVPVMPEVGSYSSMETPSPVQQEYVKMVEVYDPTSGPYGIMMIVPFLVLILLGLLVASGTQEVRPQLLEGVVPYIWYVTGGAAAAAILICLIGNFLATKPPKPAKVKTK